MNENGMLFKKHGQENMTSQNWWKGAILYQIYPRSWCDSNGDGVGDLAGITSRLEHLVDLGVDGVWISPFFTSPMLDFGYDVSNYCDVDPLFGTIADFDALINRAHSLGLKVIIDMVLSHTSEQHAWFRESAQSRNNAKSDWYVWADAQPDGTPPNNWLSIFGGSAWQWNTARQQYYLHNFLTAQPDLNIHHHDVQDALLAACRFWLDRGVDGFRLDAINFIAHDPQLRSNPARDPALLDSGSAKASNPYTWQVHLYDKSQPEAISFLHRLRNLAHGYGDILLLGEVGDDDEIARLAEYAGSGGPLDTGYCFRFLQDFVNKDLIQRTLDQMFNRPEKPWPSWAFSNHDFNRVVTRWGKKWDGPEVDPVALGCMALLLGLPGTIFIYEGEELGMPQADLLRHELRDPYDIAFYPDHMGRDGCRTPFPWDNTLPNAGFSTSEPWLPIKLPHLDRALAQQKANGASVYNNIRAMVHYRRTSQILRHGDYEIMPDHQDNVIAIRRWLNQDQSVIIVVNLGESVAQLNLALPGWSRNWQIKFSNGILETDDKASLLLEGWGYAIIERSGEQV